MAKLIHFQAGTRTTYEASTGRLVRMDLWESKSGAQYSLETWPDAESAEKAFWAGNVTWQE
jgi:hypothetical protein